jgi:hypothetical protein
MSDAVMNVLEAGYTIAWARHALVDAGDIDVFDGTDVRAIELSDIVIQGDPSTRLTTVYTGTNVLPVGTVRVIQD